MTKIVGGLKAAAALTVVGVGAVVVIAVAPLVSLVAIPIFSLKALSHWDEHKSLYNQTLTNGSRAKFGRVEGQDYTRWDGKAITQIKTNPTWQERMHELIGVYIHGQKEDFYENYCKGQADSPFQTLDDFNWLEREFTRREKKDLLDSDLKMLRAFSKALIPIVGVFWVIYSETSMSGASEVGCRVCMMGRDSENTHWGWKRAILFHQETISEKLRDSRRVKYLLPNQTART